jgi:hypothetical protein
MPHISLISFALFRVIRGQLIGPYFFRPEWPSIALFFGYIPARLTLTR